MYQGIIIIHIYEEEKKNKQDITLYIIKNKYNVGKRNNKYNVGKKIILY